MQELKEQLRMIAQCLPAAPFKDTVTKITEEAIAELEKLQARCSPSKVIMINNVGHYVSEAVAEEFEKLRQENEELSQNTCGECGPENYGWIFNAVEGKAACGCMIEAEPFQILLKALEKITDDNLYGMSLTMKRTAQEALHQVLPLNYPPVAT